MGTFHLTPQPVIALARGDFVATEKLCNSGTIGHVLVVSYSSGEGPFPGVC